MGIIINHYKDPYYLSSILESIRPAFFRGSFVDFQVDESRRVGKNGLVITKNLAVDVSEVRENHLGWC